MPGNSWRRQWAHTAVSSCLGHCFADVVYGQFSGMFLDVALGCVELLHEGVQSQAARGAAGGGSMI